MASRTVQRNIHHLTLEIPRARSRCLTSLSSPPLPSDRLSVSPSLASYFDSVKKHQDQGERRPQKNSPLSIDLKGSKGFPLENVLTPLSPKKWDNHLVTSRAKEVLDPESLPSFEDEISDLIQRELSSVALDQRQPHQGVLVEFEPRLVRSLSLGIFLPTPLDSLENNHHALLMSLESQDPAVVDRVHSEGLGPVEAGGFRFSHQRNAYRNSRGIMKILELNLGHGAVEKTDQDIVALCRKVPLPQRPHTNCQDYIVWVLVMLETLSIISEGEVARINAMGLRGHLKL